MDRIEMQGPNGMHARLAAQGATPRSDRLKPAGGDPGNAPAVALGSVGLAGSEPPIDRDRVARIRQAVEQGAYPLLPCRVADELIAAGLILRNGK
jgi:negative regulator of flagellin synthesis FlgM